MSDKNLRFLLFGEDRTAGKQFSKTAEDANSATGRIGASFSKMSGYIGGEVGDLVGRVGEGFTKMSENSGKLGDKFMAVGGIIGGVGVAAQQFASQDQAAHQQLQAAIDATGKSYDGLDKQIEDAVKSQEKYGHKASDTQDALRVMTQAFQDPKKALEDMTLVENLAAARHVSLAEAATLVAKAHGGAGRIFKEFGITVGTNKDKTKDYDGALEALSGRLSGQASAASDTFAGKVAGVRARVEDAGAAIAGKMGPALTTAGPLIMGVGAIMESKLIPSLASSVGGWVASGSAATVSAVKSLAASGVVIGGWIASAATATASGLAMAQAWIVGLGPIAWITAAVIGIGAALVLAYNKVGWFRDAVDGAWKWIKDATSTVKDWIVGAWDFVVGALARIPARIGEVFKDVTNFITAPFRLAFNTIGSMWNNTVGKMSFTVPSWVPGIGGQGFQMPHIPALAQGGIVPATPGGRLVRVAEGGQDEAIVPLPKGGMNGGPMIHIDNYNEAKSPPQVIAAEFAFMVRSL